MDDNSFQAGNAKAIDRPVDEREEKDPAHSSGGRRGFPSKQLSDIVFIQQRPNLKILSDKYGDRSSLADAIAEKADKPRNNATAGLTTLFAGVRAPSKASYVCRAMAELAGRPFDEAFAVQETAVADDVKVNVDIQPAMTEEVVESPADILAGPVRDIPEAPHPVTRSPLRREMRQRGAPSTGWSSLPPRKPVAPAIVAQPVAPAFVDTPESPGMKQLFTDLEIKFPDFIGELRKLGITSIDRLWQRMDKNYWSDRAAFEAGLKKMVKTGLAHDPDNKRILPLPKIIVISLKLSEDILFPEAKKVLEEIERDRKQQFDVFVDILKQAAWKKSKDILPSSDFTPRPANEMSSGSLRVYINKFHPRTSTALTRAERAKFLDEVQHLLDGFTLIVVDGGLSPTAAKMATILGAPAAELRQIPGLRPAYSLPANSLGHRL